jgi:hypothetical protein
MAFLTLLTLCSLAASILALPSGNATIVPRLCGATPSDEKVNAAEAEFQSFLASGSRAPHALISSASIPVYVHVIQSGTSLSQGHIP